MPFIGLLMTGHKKESLSFRIYKLKLWKLKIKVNKSLRKKEQNIWRLWDNYKRCNVRIRKKETNRKNIQNNNDWRIHSNLMSDTKSQIQEAQRTPSRINAKRNTIPRHTIFKLQKFLKRCQREKFILLTQGQR